LATEAWFHLREFRPKQFRALMEAGTLEEYVEGLGNRAKDVLDSALEQGLAHDQAMELAVPYYLLPDEEEVPDLLNNPYPR
jgi:hypothetical protein